MDIDVRKVAAGILKSVRGAFKEDQDYKAAKEKDFPHLNLSFYRKTQEAFEGLGFSKVMDMENLSLKKQKIDLRTFIRVMANRSESISAAIYHAKPRFPWNVVMYLKGFRPAKIYEMETEFSDGTFVCTGIAPLKSNMPAGEMMIKKYMHPKTNPGELLAAHLESVYAYEGAHPGVKRVAASTVQEMLDMQRRQNSIRRQYLESVGWVTKDYLRGLRNTNSELVDRIYNEIQNILAGERNAAIDIRDHVVVELRSDKLLAFDLPNEGMEYKIPDFEPGFYKIPLTAVKNAPESERRLEPPNAIFVDTGMISFVDSDYYDRLREIEGRIWEETNDIGQFIARYDDIVKELGIKYDFALSPGVGSGYDFVGDGAYVLDISLISRLSESMDGEGQPSPVEEIGAAA